MFKNIYAVITAVEPNAQHGTGSYLRNICADLSANKYIYYRGLSIYNNWCDLPGIHKIIPLNCKLPIIDILKLKFQRIKKILVLPYFENTVEFALYLQKITKAELITYILDDQNIFTKGISDLKYQELLIKSKKIFAISTEMGKAYNKKFNIDAETLYPKIQSPKKYVLNKFRKNVFGAVNCALLGNFWTQERFDDFVFLIKDEKLLVHWFGFGPDAPWLKINKELITRKKIQICGHLEESILFKKISKMPFIILPTGDLSKRDTMISFSKLSMPSRLFFCCAHTNTPILVIGHPKTAVAKFVKENNLGLIANNKKSLKKCIKIFLTKNKRQKICDSIKLQSNLFIDHNLAKKLWGDHT